MSFTPLIWVDLKSEDVCLKARGDLEGVTRSGGRLAGREGRASRRTSLAYSHVLPFDCLIT